MLVLQKPEERSSALFDDEQPILSSGIGAGDDGARAAEERNGRTRGGSHALVKVRPSLAGEQVRTLGVGENELRLRDGLESRHHGSERGLAARFKSGLEVFHLEPQQHVERRLAELRAAERERSSKDDAADRDRGGGQEPEQ